MNGNAARQNIAVEMASKISPLGNFTKQLPA